MKGDPRKLHVLIVPERHRPVPSLAIGLAIVDIRIGDDTVIEWLCLDTTSARKVASDIVSYCDDVDAMNLALSTDRGD
jgi:hypothetical protein